MKTFKICITILCLQLFVIHIQGQEVTSKFRYELGVGLSLLGSGDHTVYNIENEIDYSLNNYLELSVSLNYGRAQTSRFVFSSSFVQGNINLSVIPFTNLKKYALKFGVGASMVSINEVSVSVAHHEPDGTWVVDDYNFKDYSTIGYNLIIENSYNLSRRYSIGIKLFGQSYKNRDTNFGGIFKVGYML